MYHVRLNVNVADQYVPYQARCLIYISCAFLKANSEQDFESKQLLWDFLNTPEQFSLHIKRLTTSLASTIVYGWRTSSVDLPHVKALFEVRIDSFLLKY
jgi:hypothetical protein